MHRLRLLAVLALASAPVAQVSLTRSGGVLGETFGYSISGAPGELFLLIPSFTDGPTPLAIVDPSDPRVMDVGWELPNLWIGGALDGAGEISLSTPLSSAPALQGTVFHAQVLTLPGATTTVDDLSNPTSVTFAAAGTSVFTPFEQAASIDGHTATRLEDGRVLLAGGGDGAGALDGFRIYDPNTGRFSAAGGTMQVGRVAHTATLLDDGRVLLVGGGDENGFLSATVDVWDPVTGTATAAAPMSTPRSQHTATLLADGRVFVAGGVEAFDLADPLGALGSALESTEVYDPATDTWSSGPNLPQPRFGHAASLLSTGSVLLTGGVEVASLFGVPLPSFSDDCRRYVPASNALQNASDFSGGRAFHDQIVLPDGNVLLVGGANGDFIALTFNALASCRRYDVSANAWSNAASLNQARAYPTLLEADGALVALGGLASVDVAAGTGTPAQTIETADLAGAAWTSVSSMLFPRALPIAVAIEAGARVLVTGSGDNGSGGAVPDLTAEQFVL